MGVWRVLQERNKRERGRGKERRGEEAAVQVFVTLLGRVGCAFGGD